MVYFFFLATRSSMMEYKNTPQMPIVQPTSFMVFKL